MYNIYINILYLYIYTRVGGEYNIYHTIARARTHTPLDRRSYNFQNNNLLWFSGHGRKKRVYVFHYDFNYNRVILFVAATAPFSVERGIH